MGFWTIGGKLIVNSTGKAISCDECPCVEECGSLLDCCTTYPEVTEDGPSMVISNTAGDIPDGEVPNDYCYIDEDESGGNWYFEGANIGISLWTEDLDENGIPVTWNLFVATFPPFTEQYNISDIPGNTFCCRNGVLSGMYVHSDGTTFTL